jgi:DNA-binding NtrC family response regulator
MEENHFDVVVVDVNLSGIGGLGVLRLAREVNPDAAVIVITDYAGEGTAVAAANQGAYACFVRPLNPGEIKDAIANALKQQKLMQENRRLTNGLRGSNRLLFQANKKLQDAMTGHERRQKRFTEKKAKLKPPEEEAK